MFSGVGLNSYAMKARKCAVASVLIMILALTGCEPSTAIKTLEAIVAAAEIALPVIASASGLPPETTAAIVAYLHMVDVAVVQSSVVLAGPGTSAEKSAKIGQIFTQILMGCNCIPTGTPQTVVTVIDAVMKAVGKFLLSVGAAPMSGQPGIAPSPGAVPPEIKVKGSDKKELGKIRVRAEEHMQALGKVKK